jgi:hypothetical protein
MPGSASMGYARLGPKPFYVSIINFDLDFFIQSSNIYDAKYWNLQIHCIYLANDWYYARLILIQTTQDHHITVRDPLSPPPQKKTLCTRLFLCVCYSFLGFLIGFVILVYCPATVQGSS